MEEVGDKWELEMSSFLAFLFESCFSVPERVADFAGKLKLMPSILACQWVPWAQIAQNGEKIEKHQEMLQENQESCKLTRKAI